MKPGIEGEIKQDGPDLEQRAVVANVRHHVKRLQQANPILTKMVAEKKLRVVGAVYDLPTGKVALV
jgi:carbonic anhydrase